ncbi:MAG: AMP-dependent synthetase [Acidobacteria bacterium]|nr:MAG: AMP-dependent synthetase [Acidobacteriota bacterium]
MTLLDLLSGRDDASPAIAAVEGGVLTSAALRAEIGRHAEAIARCGVRPGDAIALVAPNGPEALVATLAAADAACVAPLNPAFTEAEFRFYLEDLGARAVVVAGECGAVAARAAVACDLPVLTLRPAAAGPGIFHLECPAGQPSRTARDPGHAPGTALLLHTSGTTSRPKLVALGRESLCRSARAIAASLRLGPADVCLNVMPLFHVHGLIGAALSSLAAGGAVCCAPGFNPHRFLRWLETSGATWYTAVPTIHQAVVARASSASATPPHVRRPLRFVRSCSSPLPMSVREALAAAFEVPVINAYGMTEATHQVSCTPFPPAGNGPGCRRGVGLSTGPDVRVLGPNGEWLPAGEPGEIALRGATVITAYERPEEANRTSFHEGWLRTGDEGVIDGEGGNSLTGRLKELINSGGEKISPYEIEDVLLRCPGVSEAVCFAVPHRSRGEAVGAAVVLGQDGAADEKALRRFAARQLAAFKVPERILLLDRLPKGPTGKLQRIGLAARLGIEN